MASLDVSLDVSVVIPVRDDADVLTACLESIQAQRTTRSFEVIVADGESTDRTREVARTFHSRFAAFGADLLVLDNPDHTAASGLNRAIDAARGEVIVRVDARTRVAPDYIETCADALSRTKADLVGGTMIARGEGMIGRTLAWSWRSGFGSGASAYRSDVVEHDTETDTVYLGAWPRASFERFGKFDERFVRNQDDEFSFRIRDAGGRVVLCPEIRSIYVPRESPSAVFRQYYGYGRWKPAVHALHPERKRLRHFVPSLMVIIGVAITVAAFFSSSARLVLVGLVIVYEVVAMATAWRVRRDDDVSLLPWLGFVAAMQHVGYGVGYLAGMIMGVVGGGVECRPRMPNSYESTTTESTTTATSEG